MKKKMKNIPNNLKYSPMRIEIVTSIIAVHEFAPFLVTFREVNGNFEKVN